MKKLMGILLLALIAAGSLFAGAELPENLSGIAPGKTTGPNANKMFADIDKTYLEAYTAWKKFGQIYLKAGSFAGTLDKSNIIAGKVAEIRQNSQNSIDALEGFKRIPVIGKVALASQLTLKSTASQVDKVKGSLEGVNTAVLNPVTKKTIHLKNCVVVSEEEVYKVLKQLHAFKNAAAEKCSMAANSKDSAEKEKFEQGAAKISQMLSGYGSAFAALNERETGVNEINNVISTADPVFDKSIRGLDDFMSKFSGSRKAVHEINKVLDKRFRKKIFTKQISISVRDVLTGGGALKKVKGVLKKVGVDIEKWARDALNPVTKKLMQKLPGIPKFDEIYAKADELKSKMDVISNTSNSFLSYKKSVEDFNKDFRLAGKEISATSTPDISAAKYKKIENRWKKTHVNIEHGSVQCSKAAPGWHSAMWVIEEIPGQDYVRIQNRWKKTYLNVEHGKLECSAIQPGWHSAMWKVERVPGTEYYNITNRWKNTSLHIEHGKMECSQIAPGWHSAMWALNDFE